MSQFNHMQTYGGNASPTMEQLLRDGEASRWSTTHSLPGLGKDHDPEEDIDHHQKKSVFAKVKEKAKKLRYTLSNKKKHGEDENTTPSWGYNLDEDEDEDEDHIDAEYLGAPMYESELAPEDCKENARQHPRADPVIAENHVLANTIKLASGQDKQSFNSSETSSQIAAGSSLGNSKTTETTKTTETATTDSTMKKIQKDEVANPSSPNKTLTETVTEKLAPVYSTVTDATHAIASKIQRLTVSAPSMSTRSSPTTPKKAYPPTIQKTCSASSTPQAPKLGKGAEQIWDKGVSVKEYLMHKFEPGEDDRALSQVLSDALSPRTKPGDVGVVEKMREAVNSMLRAEAAPQPKATHMTAKSLSQVDATPQPVAAHLAVKSSSLAEKAPELEAAKSSLQAETTPQPMAAHSAAKPSSRAEKAQQLEAAQLAAKPSSRGEKAPQLEAAQLAAKPSSRGEKAPQLEAAQLAAKSPSQGKEAPQAMLTTHLVAKPSLPAEATPQPVVAHLAAKSSSSSPIFTTTYRVAEEENLERILQAN